jgi:hypothetical protein
MEARMPRITVSAQEPARGGRARWQFVYGSLLGAADFAGTHDTTV